MTGHWTVDFNETGCSPWWNPPSDQVRVSSNRYPSLIVSQGCDGTKRVGVFYSHSSSLSNRILYLQRYNSHLMNIKNKEDWEVLCKTTPIVIKDVSYNGAMSCEDSVGCDPGLSKQELTS